MNDWVSPEITMKLTALGVIPLTAILVAVMARIGRPAGDDRVGAVEERTR